MDCTEHFISKSADPAKERATFSGKAGTNTKKTLAVIDKHGREQWASSDLYMNAGDYFSPGETVAADGGFKGDGPIKDLVRHP
jgi:hypothetical protein